MFLLETTKEVITETILEIIKKARKCEFDEQFKSLRMGTSIHNMHKRTVKKWLWTEPKINQVDAFGFAVAVDGDNR